MSTLVKSLFVFTAALFAFAVSAQAQLVTYETQSAYDGSSITFTASGSNASRGQIFTDVSAVAKMTYNFFTGTSGNATATTLTATFGEWNTATNTFVSGTTVSFGTITIPASNSGSWTTLTNANGTFITYEYAFDLTTLTSALVNSQYGYLTDSTKSYALMLSNTTGVATGLALGLTNDDVFAYGSARGFSDYDWSFSQIVVAPGSQSLTPIPESGTVASIAVGVMVAGLVGFRMNQRRRVSAAPEVAA